MIESEGKMKYHCEYAGESKAVCGVPNRPDTFVFDIQGFVEHTNENDRCKTCKRIVKDMSKLGYVALSLMIIIDKWGIDYEG